MTDEAVFPRNFLKKYPRAVRGEGCFVYTDDGRRYLDASGGAAVVTIGHGVESVARAMAEQASRLAYVHSSQYHSAVVEKLAQRVLALAPQGMRNVCSTAIGVGAHRAVLLLPVSLRAEVSRVQCRVCGRSRAFVGRERCRRRGSVYF